MADSPVVTTPRAEWRRRDLASRLVEVAALMPRRIALAVDGRQYDYQTLFGGARRIATLLANARGTTRPDEVGAVLGTRSADCFAGLLGTLFSGAAYLPLNPKFPPVRTDHMLRSSGARTLILDRAHLDAQEGLLRELLPIAIVVPDLDEVGPVARRLPRHALFGAAAIAASPPIEVRPAPSEAMAYLMFTSGSTGTPKGVMVSHRNVMECIASFGDRYDIGCEDRLSQNFELTFDLSVFDMFAAWLHGASLHVAPPAQQPCPAKFVAASALTIWFSVPSLALFMEQMRALPKGAFPSLRWSLFCGERLPARVAETWAAAAPGSIVENLYGPTEVTIACTVHRFDPGSAGAGRRSVPIGKPLPGLTAALVDDQLAEVAPGQEGELCMAGPQVALGYWNAPDQTAARFVKMPWDADDRRWYRTGDVAVLTDGELLDHRGRTDDQVKVRGYRIELGEIEAVLRRLLDTEAIAAIAVSGRPADTVAIVAFVAGREVDEPALRRALAAELPAYMHPAEFVALRALPLTANGKTDKVELRRRYLEEHGLS